jgi:hypothetical protein
MISLFPISLSELQMSEYQYYEFQAIDRPLTTEEQAEIDKLSSRAKVTPNQAVFVYNYGDFRGSAEAVLIKYFDAMLYMANWGTWQLMFRFPKSLINLKLFKPYDLPDVITITSTANHIVLDITITDEEGMSVWAEGEGWLPKLLPLREDLMAGDLRLLYLVWLQVAPNLEEDAVEPPIPPNLEQLSKPLKAYIEWIELDPDLVEAAAQASPSYQTAEIKLEKWLPALTEAEKQKFLLKLVKREPQVDLQLIGRLKELAGVGKPAASLTTGSRTFSEIHSIADNLTKEKQQKDKKAAQLKRTKYLETLSLTEDQTWQQVLDLIATKQSKSYDEATVLLQDIRDLAKSRGQLTEFSQRLEKLRSSYSGRPALMSRLKKINLDN